MKGKVTKTITSAGATRATNTNTDVKPDENNMYSLNPTMNAKSSKNLFSATGAPAGSGTGGGGATGGFGGMGGSAQEGEGDAAVFERFRRHLQAATKKWYDAKNAKHPSVEVCMNVCHVCMNVCHVCMYVRM